MTIVLMNLRISSEVLIFLESRSFIKSPDEKSTRRFDVITLIPLPHETKELDYFAYAIIEDLSPLLCSFIIANHYCV